ETDRLSLGHYIMREIWQGNFLSPISDTLKQGARVLDVGTGNGTWICELAADYQKSQYVGIDILNLQPSIRPFNVQFIQHDILKGLPFEDNSFDFIHVREMIFDIKVSDWSNIMYKELYRVLKPGGWLEIIDPELYWHDSGPVMTKLCNSVRERLCSQGINPFIAKRHKELIQSMPGLTFVQQEERVYPLGPWAGKVGVLAESFLKETCK
ncbi:2533_t:CDS:2, partial [Cetraspora pellucida]